MRSLKLSVTDLSNIDWITGFSQLGELVLEVCDVVDLDVVARLSTITQLHLNSIRCVDLSFLAALPQLKSLNLSYLGDHVTLDLDMVSEEITALELDGFPQSTLSAMLRFRRLVSLGLEGLDSLEGVDSLRELERLHCGAASFLDLSPLAEHPTLTRLVTQTSMLTELTPLASLSHLRELIILGGSNLDLQAITDLQLTTLKLPKAQFFDPAPLSNLRSLEHLNLSGTNLKTLTWLLRLNQLRTLDVSWIRKLDASALAEMTPLALLTINRSVASELDDRVARRHHLELCGE